MFKPADKTELNQISLTGMRAIALIGLLVKAPRTLEEIRQKFIELNIMEPEHSDDILRIDLNTLRTMGCEITKANVTTDFKYILLNHPFTVHFTEEEIHVLKRAYKWIKDSANLELLLKYHELFNKVAEYVSNNETREILHGLSILKSCNVDLIKELLEDCKYNRILEISYNTPGSKKESIKEISAQKIVLENDKIYLYGFNFNTNTSIILKLKRIKSILCRKNCNGNIEIKETKVKFFLKSFGVTKLEANECILESSKDGYLIEGIYYNDFIATQRILSFGEHCTVLEPEEFKLNIIEKLKNMRKVYND